MISERQCIELIQQYASDPQDKYLIKGIGDDCAVISKNDAELQLLTTDTLVEGVHFDLEWHDPYLLGRKSVAVNLSDIAAMGGQPKACLLSVAFPEGVPSWFKDFMKGFSEILAEYDTLLVGGDTVRGNRAVVISVMLLGEVNRDHICYRSGAQPGDAVLVSGTLGNAAAGLAICRKGLHKSGDLKKTWQQLVKAHLDPVPLVNLGSILAGSGMVQAMMDISDGLATDLSHICRESGVGAEIRQEFLPVSETLVNAAAGLQAEAVDWALKGGEDYQLLFTVKPPDEPKLRQLVADRTGSEIFTVGHIIAGQGVYLCNHNERKEISFQGYDHFPG